MNSAWTRSVCTRTSSRAVYGKELLQCSAKGSCCDTCCLALSKRRSLAKSPKPRRASKHRMAMGGTDVAVHTGSGQACCTAQDLWLELQLFLAGEAAAEPAAAGHVARLQRQCEERLQALALRPESQALQCVTPVALAVVAAVPARQICSGTERTLRQKQVRACWQQVRGSGARTEGCCCQRARI